MRGRGGKARVRLRWTGQHTQQDGSHPALRDGEEERKERKRTRLTWKHLDGTPRSRREGEAGVGEAESKGEEVGEQGHTHTHIHACTDAHRLLQ